MRRLLLLAVALVLLAPTIAARAGEATTSTSTEAWYATLPSVSPRPTGTLHIGVTAGLEDSRTYLALDMSGVPTDADSGTLTLPIDAADSSAPETAVIDVCSAKSAGPSVEGSTDAPPPIDCSVHAPARIGADAVTVDLGPFLDRLRTTALALVPTTGGSASWHVALFGRANPKHITATFHVPDPEPSPAVAAPTTTTTAETAPVFSAPGNELASPAPFELPPAPVHQAPVVAAPSLGTSPIQTSVPTTSRRYADSVVFTLPLVLLAVGAYFASALTKPIELPRARRRAPLAPEQPASD
jgi:hypothetical protein